MVPGPDRFRAHFEGLEDSYALIGGAACSLIFDEAGLDFRATKDIDMVLCVEVVDGKFATALKAFLDAGGYAARQRSEGRREFHRFQNPKDGSYPAMLELFSNRVGIHEIEDGDELATVPVADDVLGLSAILLDPDCHAALVASRRAIDGVHVLDESLLIPFKARAFVDLYRRREAGDQAVRRDDIKKHRNDVFRLIQLLRADQKVAVAEPLKTDLRDYMEAVGTIGSFDPSRFGVQLEPSEGFELLADVYAL
ncbi:MAG: hypothetical protein F4X97_12990 [Boseongicola sp. SB0662_bin_57]|nr:hypothetical protein [Boseongicola sp. SB0662_bin_57]